MDTYIVSIMDILIKKLILLFFKQYEITENEYKNT